MNKRRDGDDGFSRDPDLSVIVVTYNSVDTIDKCLSSVLETSGLSIEVIVVDNQSRDATVSRARTHPVGVLAQDENLGFARGCNIGASNARGRRILFLNPDTAVQDDAIGISFRYLDDHPDTGAVGALTIYDDQTVNPTCCFAQPSLWGTFTRAVGLAKLVPNRILTNPEEIGGWDRLSTREVGAITGCFLMLDRMLFHDLGGFDERFFMYSEDTDLSLRVQARGLSCVHVHEAVVIHHGGRSDSVPSEKMVKVFRARALLFEKHWSPTKAKMGVVLLDATAALRCGAAWVSRLWPGRQRASKWPAVWRQRSQWHFRTGDHA